MTGVVCGTVEKGRAPLAIEGQRRVENFPEEMYTEIFVPELQVWRIYRRRAEAGHHGLQTHRIAVGDG